jgi:hypothetical protein
MNVTFEEFATLRRRATVARDSLQASLGGYIAGGLILTAQFSKGLRLATTNHEVMILVFWELVVSFIFSLIGWLVYILPVAWAYRPRRWMDRAWVAAACGGILGLAMIAAISIPWIRDGSRNGRLIWASYEISAFVNAAFASYLCVVLRQRGEVRTRAIHQRLVEAS